MAESDAAGLVPTGGTPPPAPPPKQPASLPQFWRDMERATERLRAVQRAADAFTAPIRAAAKAHEKVLEPIRAMERQRRAFQANVDAVMAAANPFHIKSDGSFAEWCNGEILREWREMEGWSPPPPNPTTTPAAVPTAAHRPAPSPSISDAELFKLVDRIADEVVRRIAANSAAPTALVSKGKSRRGSKRREISVGGVDAALEALAAEDPSVLALSARKLAESLGDKFAYTTIQKSPVYKTWRKKLRDLRRESKAFGIEDLLEAGLANIGTRKPGRQRQIDPTVDPEMEERTRAFLKAHEDEGLDGQ